MSAHHIILASLTSFCQKLPNLVEIWRNSDKKKFAQFFLRHGVVTFIFVTFFTFLTLLLLLLFERFYIYCEVDRGQPARRRRRRSAAVVSAGTDECAEGTRAGARHGHGTARRAPRGHVTRRCAVARRHPRRRRRWVAPTRRRSATSRWRWWTRLVHSNDETTTRLW